MQEAVGEIHRSLLGEKQPPRLHPGAAGLQPGSDRTEEDLRPQPPGGGVRAPACGDDQASAPGSSLHPSLPPRPPPSRQTNEAALPSLLASPLPTSPAAPAAPAPTSPTPSHGGPASLPAPPTTRPAPALLPSPAGPGSRPQHHPAQGGGPRHPPAVPRPLLRLVLPPPHCRPLPRCRDVSPLAHRWSRGWSRGRGSSCCSDKTSTTRQQHNGRFKR